MVDQTIDKSHIADLEDTASLKPQKQTNIKANVDNVSSYNGSDITFANSSVVEEQHHHYAHLSGPYVKPKVRKQVVRRDFTNMRYPCRGFCTRCKRSNPTIVGYEFTNRQWCYCASLAIVGCVWFSCIPFCLNDCYNVRHNCSLCGKYLGCSNPKSILTKHH